MRGSRGSKGFVRFLAWPLFPCLLACSTTQNRAETWEIYDGCWIKVSGITTHDFEGTLDSINISENCVLEIDSEKVKNGTQE